MNTLREAVNDYLAMRRGLGFKLCKAGTSLLDFVSFLEQQGVSHISTRLALAWAQQPASAQPAHWAQRLSFVRGFALYRSASDERTEIPPTALLSYQPKRARPYFYTDDDVIRILEEALHLSRSTPFKRRTYHCLIGLLVVSGMRIGEVINLKMENVDLTTGVLTVEGSKFGKSRLIPLHASTQLVLAKYISCRKKFLKLRSANHLFVSNLGNRLDAAQVRRAFYVISRRLGLRGQKSSTGPRLHDFRHLFARNTLLRWYQNGENVEALLPVLSTFLGHVHVADTYWYLTSCPELMGAAAKKLENWWEVKHDK
jgi:integrase/recombinase XerD